MLHDLLFHHEAGVAAIASGGGQKSVKKSIRGAGFPVQNKLSILQQMQQDDDEVAMILAMAIGEMI